MRACISYLDALLAALGLTGKVRRGGALYLPTASLDELQQMKGVEWT